jgi:hypothetical protein
MRSRLEKPVRVPLKYRRYRAEDWREGGWHQWVTEREAWAKAQPPVIIAGQRHDGTRYAYPATPLGDLTDLIRARREARMLDLAYAGQ